MDVQSFSTYFTHLRDHNQPVLSSWIARLGMHEEHPEFLEISSIVPFEKLTTDDLLFALVAGAMVPEISHVSLNVFPCGCSSPEGKLEELVTGLERTGFMPYEFDWDFNNETGDKALLMSVFSEDEAYRIHDLYVSRTQQ